LAAAAACLALAYPVRLTTHLWYANSPQQLAILLLLASLLCHERWMRERGPILLAGSLAAYATSVLAYESTAFMPVLLVAVRSKAPLRRSAIDAARNLWPYALVL